ncbi:MAG TPA: endonuclease III domain-containing protein [Dehalococcoidia bacterium]|jgi:endonuclease-3 related protein|nr:endonuclease III domain-containing protein [Dehalococcoidia bacterium]
MRNEKGVSPRPHFPFPISPFAVYDRLYSAYGPQHWWPGDSAFETIAGAILTQSASWANVEKALSNLKAAGALSPQGIAALSTGDLARLIHPSGYFNTKARKLKAFVGLLDERFSGDLDRMLESPTSELRAALLETHGIGPETADSIILYAANKPLFVIDAYTRRTFSRLGLVPERDSYDDWQALFMEELPADVSLFNEYHALIVRHAKDVCRKQPLCGRCPLLEICPTASQ